MIPLSQMIWLRSVTDHPSEPKKGGLYGCSVRKSDFWATFGPKKKTKILCWPRCTAGLGAAAAGFSACNCLFDSHNCLLTSLILDPYYKLNWPKRASAVYWLFGTLLYPCSECLNQMLKTSPSPFLQCPICKKVHGVRTGNRPQNGTRLNLLHVSYPS